MPQEYWIVVWMMGFDDGIHFDVGIGVSAGSANVASYLDGQKGRNYHFYVEYSRIMMF